MLIGVDGRYIQDHFPGIGRYTYNLIRSLAEIAPRDRFLVLYDPKAPNRRYHLSALASYPNIELVPVEVSTLSLAEQYRLPSLIKGLKVDLLHWPYYIKPYLLALPSVVTLYDLIPKIYPQYMPSAWARLAFEVAVRLAIRNARRVISVSHSAKRDVVRLLGVRPSQVSVTPLGVEGRFRPLGEGVLATARDRYGLPERYVLYLGINKPHKNLVRLVEAFSKVETSYPLVLAGREDPRYPQAREAVARLGVEERVIFLGEVADGDLPALYSGATLFVFPSLYEGFGLPVLEAMACGTPMVCSKASSLPEIVGSAALMVDPFDTASLAEAMGRALGDGSLRATMREKGLERAAGFTWERTARETLSIYEEALQ